MTKQNKNSNQKPSAVHEYPGIGFRDWLRTNRRTATALASVATLGATMGLLVDSVQKSKSELEEKADTHAIVDSTGTSRDILPGDTITILPEETVSDSAESKLMEEMTAYLESDTRNNEIFNFMDRVGSTLVERVQAGETGWDIYYPGTDEADAYVSKTGFREGWAWLQYVPEFGKDKDLQWSVTVYTKADGTFDLSKGTLDVFARQIGPNNTTIRDASLERPNSFLIATGDEQVLTSRHAVTRVEDTEGVIEQIDSSFVPGYESEVAGLKLKSPDSVSAAESLDRRAITTISEILDIK